MRVSFHTNYVESNYSYAPINKRQRYRQELSFDYLHRKDYAVNVIQFSLHSETIEAPRWAL